MFDFVNYATDVEYSLIVKVTETLRYTLDTNPINYVDQVYYNNYRNTPHFARPRLVKIEPQTTIWINPSSPNSIGSRIMEEIDKLNTQYKEGAIVATEGIFKIVSLYANNADELAREYNEVFKYSDKSN